MTERDDDGTIGMLKAFEGIDVAITRERQRVAACRAAEADRMIREMHRRWFLFHAYAITDDYPNMGGGRGGK